MDRRHPNAARALRRLIDRLPEATEDERTLLASRIPHLTAIRRITAEVAESGDIQSPARYADDFPSALYRRGIERLTKYIVARARVLGAISDDGELLVTILGGFRRLLIGYARSDAYADLRREKSPSRSLSPTETAGLPGRDDPRDQAAVAEAKRRLIAAITKLVAEFGPRDRTIIEHKLVDKPAVFTASELGMTTRSLHVATSRLYRRIRAAVPPDLVQDLFPCFKPGPKG